METPNAVSSAAVLDLLREQELLYARLERFAERQRVLVTQSTSGPLLELLADRQRLAMKLQEIARELEPVRSRWSILIASWSQDEQKEANELVQRCGDHLRRVMASDEEDARLLAVRKASVSQEIQGHYASTKAVFAYGESRSAIPGSTLDGYAA